MGFALINHYKPSILGTPMAMEPPSLAQHPPASCDVDATAVDAWGWSRRTRDPAGTWNNMESTRRFYGI